MLLSRRRFTLMMAGVATCGIYASQSQAQAQTDSATRQARPARSVTFADGRVVPAIGMGSWHLGQGRHTPQQEMTALQMGIDLGMSLIDTAEMYGEGRSETLIGQAIKGRRDQVTLVSKVYPWHANRAMMNASCDASLKRLGTDHLDVYLLHWRGDISLPETVDAFERLRTAGKIRSWGVSNFDVGDMNEVDRLPNGSYCATDQVLYNLSTRNMEFALQPWCRQHRMPIMAYSPLGSGSDLLRSPVLAQIAKKHGVTPAAVALAWTIRIGQVIAVPESGDPVHIRENAAALNLVLEQSDLASLDTAYPGPSAKAPLPTL